MSVPFDEARKTRVRLAVYRFLKALFVTTCIAIVYVRFHGTYEQEQGLLAHAQLASHIEYRIPALGHASYNGLTLCGSDFLESAQ
jgi:hypothetical protein